MSDAPAAGARRRLVLFALAALLLGMVAAGTAVIALRHPAMAARIRTEVNDMPSGNIRRAALALLAWIAPAGPGLAQPAANTPLPPPRPLVLGMNAPEIRYYGTTVPFANLIIGSDWNNSRWEKLSEEHQDANGNLRSLPADNVVLRHLSVPPTGPEGFEVRCTFTGSGTLTLAGGGKMIAASANSLRFRLVKQLGNEEMPWLVLRDFDPKRPLRDLDCRDVRLDRSARFRPEFLATLRGYGVIRFMDWQNANANEAVTWAGRQTPDSNRFDRDGVAIENMLLLVRELGADPWFVMPWNADDDYIVRFARMVAAQLPADRSVYVEVGNEVWNDGFPVTRQAIKEGLERKLGADNREAGMRRYAQRTVEIMRPWEAAFGGRRGLVRVLSTQHVQPLTAQIALSFRDTAGHVDALATAPYFGALIGGTETTRESGLRVLANSVTETLKQAVDNRRVAAAYGKRYIAYEGGQGLVLPAQVALLDQIQHDPAMYDLYRRYFAGWRREVGDVLCLLTSVAPPGSSGSWGVAARENETPAEAPKLRAVQEELAGQRH